MTVRGIQAGSTGVWQLTADLDVARHLAAAGFDWLALDAQHGAVDRAALLALGRALSDAGTNFVVRVPGVDPVWVGAALDAGAAGVVVPSVETVQDAEAVARAARYPPRGVRSWGPYAVLWGSPAPSPAVADTQVQCAVMVETRSALTQVDTIAAVGGVDAIFVGPFDLALSLGTTVDDLLADDRPDAPIPTVVRAARRSGRLVAAFAGDRDRAAALRAQGIDALAVATDLGLLDLAARQAATGPAPSG